MKALVFFALLVSLAIATIPPQCSRPCDNRRRLITQTTPFNCSGPNCVDWSVPGRVTNRFARYLDCPSKSAVAATERTSGCGGGGSHAFWFGPVSSSSDGFGCTNYVFEESLGASTGIFNEFDDDGDGDFERAELSGILRCRDSSNPRVRRIRVNMFLTASNTPNDIKNELGGSCSANLQRTWYFYSIASATLEIIGANPSTLEGTVINFNRFNSGDKRVQVGQGASMKNSLFGLTVWIGFTSVVYPPNAGYTFPSNWFNPNRHAGDVNINLFCSQGCPDNPPPPECGNLIVEQGEQCDGGPCCTDECELRPNTFVCRESAGECDVPETCTGTNPRCPADQYLPPNTPCGELFGLCEVATPTFCPGNRPTCTTVPVIEDISPIAFRLIDYNAISFGGFIANTGDIEGRLAVRNSASFGAGYSVGDKTVNDGSHSEEYSPYALIVGHDLTWVSGQIYPLGNNGEVSEGIFVGGVYNIPFYLETYVIGDCLLRGPNCLDSTFDAYRTYYSLFQQRLSAFPQNVVFGLRYQGIYIRCVSRNSVAYTVNIDAAQFNQITWYSIFRCNPRAAWIFNIGGSGDVNFQGDWVPAIAERVVYNVLGSGRTINVNTGVRGNILAPYNTLNQPSGVIIGKVIVGDVTLSLQINLPDCYDLIPVQYTTFVLSNEGNCFRVNSVGGFVVGDTIYPAGNSGDSRTIVSITELPGQDDLFRVCLNGPFNTVVGTNSRLVTDVNANAASFASRDDAQFTTEGSAASSVVASFVVLLALLAVFLF